MLYAFALDRLDDPLRRSDLLFELETIKISAP
jgi:hypothetical protein